MADDGQFDGREIYQIRVEGVLGSEWSDWFGGVTVVPQANGETLLVGPIVDQAALHGLLNKIHDLGLSLLSVRRERDREARR
jgi:hypothetical protein